MYHGSKGDSSNEIGYSLSAEGGSGLHIHNRHIACSHPHIVLNDTDGSLKSEKWCVARTLLRDDSRKDGHANESTRAKEVAA